MDKITQRIKALLDKANDAGATQAEAEAAMALAHEMLVKHNLSLADLVSTDGATVEDAGEHPWNQPWQRRVWQAICRLYFCDFFFIPRGTKPSLFFVVGREANRETAKLVAQFLVDTGNRLALAHAQGNVGNSVSLSNNFKKGYAMAIAGRAEELKKASIEEGSEGTGTALAVLDAYATADLENSAHMEGVKKAKTSSKITNRQALVAGFEAGSTVSLSPQVFSTPAAKSLGT